MRGATTRALARDGIATDVAMMASAGRAMDPGV
jgi:hypothetical protein